MFRSGLAGNVFLSLTRTFRWKALVFVSWMQWLYHLGLQGRRFVVVNRGGSFEATCGTVDLLQFLHSVGPVRF